MIERIVDGRTDLVFDWLGAGHAADETDAHGTSLLQWCAYYGDVSAMRLLLNAGAKLDALGANFDLNGAAYHGHWQLCQFLIERGADVHAALPDTGETPLHSALCKAARPAYNLVLEVLLAANADPNRATIPGVETGAFMRDCRTRGETPLHRAAAFGDERAIEMLLAAGARVDVRDVNGDTPLSWASWHSRPGSILRLLCHGDYFISEAGCELYVGDRGNGWGGMEASLRGRPHV